MEQQDPESAPTTPTGWQSCRSNTEKRRLRVTPGGITFDVPTPDAAVRQHASPRTLHPTPVIGTLEHSKLHKRRASDALIRSPSKAGAASISPPPSSGDSSLYVKRQRIENTTPATAVSDTNTVKEAGSDNKDSPRPVSAARSAVSRRRTVLLNKPSASPYSPGSPSYKFSIISALTSHVDVLINVVRFLSPRTLVYLYSISAPFHYMMDSHFTQFVMASCNTWAPNAEFFFPWRCFRDMCIHDPAMRKPRDLRKGSLFDRKTGRSESEAQDVNQEGPRSSSGSGGPAWACPSLRWLKMVTYREIVSQEIVAYLAVAGHYTPVRAMVDAVKKLWFLIDLPASFIRLGLMRNRLYFPNHTLYALTMFFLKLDMYYTDPICFTGGEFKMREYLLSERTLTTMWNFLRGASGNDRIDILRLWVKHGYKRPPRYGPETKEEQIKNDAKLKMPILGVQPHLVGRWGYETWGLGRHRLARPDELVMRETMIRGFDAQRHWMRMMRWGTLDNNLKTRAPVKAENVVWTLVKRRKREEMAKKEAEQAAEEAAKLPAKPSVERFFTVSSQVA